VRLIKTHFIDNEGKVIKHISAKKFRRLKKTLRLLMAEVPKGVTVHIQLNYFQVDSWGVELLADIYYSLDGDCNFAETVQTFAG